MARLQKDVVNYFPHDANACAGDTLTVLQSRFGNDGYAFWFKLLEKLASRDGHYLDCRNSTKWQLLLAKTGVNAITGVEIMNLLVEMQAIDKELWKSKVIWCQKLVDNVADVYKNRRREIPQKPIITDNKLITTSNNPITTAGSTQSKVNESKVNESKVNESKQKKIKDIPLSKNYGEFKNVYLTDEEYQKLEDRFGGSVLGKIEALSIGIESKGYKYKSHYATILAWQRRDEKQVKSGKEPSKPLPPRYYAGQDPDRFVKGKYGKMVQR